MAKATQKSKRNPLEFKTDTACVERGRAIEPLLSLFAFLVSLREEFRAREEIRAQRQRYADKNGFILVRDDEGRDFCYLRRPSPCNPPLVEAAAAEDDSDDWSELEAMHRAQRHARGTAKHGGKR